MWITGKMGCEVFVVVVVQRAMNAVQIFLIAQRMLAIDSLTAIVESTRFYEGCRGQPMIT